MSILDQVLGLVHGLASSSNKTVLVLGLGIAFLCTYFLILWFTDVKKSTAVAIAFIPILGLDLLVSMGSYTFRLPFNISYTIDRGSMTLGLFDYIFNFGIFKHFGLQTFNQEGAYTLTGLQNILVFLAVGIDSLIEFALIGYILYYFVHRWDYALFGAAIPTLAYTALVSNPLKEFPKAQADIQHLLYFLNSATTEQKAIVVGTATISFALVVFLISTATSLIEGIGRTTIRPSLEAHQYQVSFSGLAFGLALAYSVIVILHPEYSFYVVLPGLVVYSAFRSGMKGAADRRKQEKKEKEWFQELARSTRERK